MGTTVCRAVAADPDLVLAAALDPRLAGIDLGQATGVTETSMQVLGSKESLDPSTVDVAVDFTQAGAAHANALYCAKVGINIVIGTTGMSDDQMQVLDEAFANSTASCIIAANFAIGAVLMMKFAEMAAPLFETAEVVELHHENKIDAPSGTALVTAQRIVAARNGKEMLADPTISELPGARGHRIEGGVHLHSLRLKGVVAHQEVIFGTTGQTLTIRHDSYDRSSFMPGVLMAIKAIAGLRGLTIGLDGVLDSWLRP